MSLQERFEKAVNHIQNLPAEGEYQPSNDERLLFYSYFKQATQGPNNTPKPKFHQLIAKAKWDAWKKLGKMSKEKAMEKYIAQFLSVARKLKDPQVKSVIKEFEEAAKKGVKGSGAAGSDSSVVLYGNKLSQPARSLEWFCKLNSISYEYRTVDIGKGEHLSDAYASINPLKKVPALSHNGFAMFESCAILRYLAETFPVADNWYPKDAQGRAKVNMYLDWHHGNTRAGCAGLLFAKWLMPLRTGNPPNEDSVNEKEKMIHASFKTIDQIFLKNQSFLAGNQPSIADLIAYQEIVQLAVVNHPYRTSGKYPTLVQWLERMEQLPHLKEVNVVLEKVTAKARARL